jgi:hypothetical protein
MPGGASRGRACARREALGRKGFRAARWGGKGVRLQCSLRPGPAGARWLGLCWGCAGVGAVVEEGARLLRRFHGVSVCGVSVCVGWGCRSGDGGGVPGGASRGRVCARREALGRKGFRAARWGIKGVRLQCSLRPGPAGARWLGCAGGGAVVEEGARLLRRFHGVSVCGVSVCGVSVCVGWGCRSGDGGGVPGGASRGRVCARREALGRKGFRAARWGGKGVRLQCSLRPGPAGARWLGLCWGCAGVGASVEEGDL